MKSTVKKIFIELNKFDQNRTTVIKIDWDNQVSVGIQDVDKIVYLRSVPSLLVTKTRGVQYLVLTSEMMTNLKSMLLEYLNNSSTSFLYPEGKYLSLINSHEYLHDGLLRTSISKTRKMRLVLYVFEYYLIRILNHGSRSLFDRLDSTK